MKEFVKIRLEELEGVTSEEMLNDQLYFDFKTNNSPYAKYSGRPISVYDDVLTLKTQLYYENIPLSEMDKGASIELYSNFKKENKVGVGEVESRDFVGTIKSDWKIEKEIELDNSDVISINFKLDLKAKKALELGDLPLSMDDKWFLYVEHNIFHYYRSWTGIEIFKGEIKEIEADKWLIDTVIISRELNVNLDEKKRLIQDLLKYGISRKLAVIESYKIIEVAKLGNRNDHNRV